MSIFCFNQRKNFQKSPCSLVLEGVFRHRQFHQEWISVSGGEHCLAPGCHAWPQPRGAGATNSVARSKRDQWGRWTCRILLFSSSVLHWGNCWFTRKPFEFTSRELTRDTVFQTQQRRWLQPPSLHRFKPSEVPTLMGEVVASFQL